jgi:hypothetical protein
MTAPLFQEAKPPEPAPEQPDPLAPDENAPYGYTIDPATKEKRPKLRPGRQRKDAPPKPPAGVSPSLEELKALKGAEPKQAASREDVAPRESKAKRGTGALKGAAAKLTAESDRPFRAGPIAKGVNRIYKKTGKIISLWDRQVGKALILCTVKDDDDDTTVGEAWEELARVNPRIRGFLERLIQGGAWTALFYAHAPLFLAVLMKDSVRSRLPMANLVMAWMDDDDQDDDDAAAAGPLGNLIGDLQQGDMAQMMAMAQSMMANLGAQMPRQPEAPTRESAA